MPSQGQCALQSPKLQTNQSLALPKPPHRRAKHRALWRAEAPPPQPPSPYPPATQKKREQKNKLKTHLDWKERLWAHLLNHPSLPTAAAGQGQQGEVHPRGVSLLRGRDEVGRPEAGEGNSL